MSKEFFKLPLEEKQLVLKVGRCVRYLPAISLTNTLDGSHNGRIRAIQELQSWPGSGQED